MADGGTLNTRANQDICAECGAMVRGAAYHPHAFCVLVKAGLDPEEVFYAALRFYERNGWPEAKPDA